MLTDRPNGISMLLASQNAIATVEMCVLSNLCFADEIIAVDNGSTDGTVEVLAAGGRARQAHVHQRAGYRASVR